MLTPFETDTPINKSLVMATVPLGNRKVVYSTGVRQWYAGQVAKLDAAVELSTYYANPYTAGKFFCFGVDNQDATGVWLNGEANGEVVNPPSVNPGSQNHKIIDDSVVYQFTADYYGCINFCVYTYTSVANGEVVMVGDPTGGSATNYGSMEGLFFDAADCRQKEVYNYSPTPPSPPPALNGTILTETLNFNGTWGNNSVRQIIPVSRMAIPPNAVTKFRVTLKAGASGMNLPGVFIGIKSGTHGYSSVVPLLFGGNANAVVPANGTLTSDFATLTGWNKATDLVVGFDTNAAAQNEAYASNAAYNYYYKQPTGDASSLSPAGYTLGAGLLLAVNKIETDGF